MRSLEEVLAHDAVPTLPAFALEVIELCGREDVGLPEVALLVQNDAAIASRLLALANSPLFGIGREVGSLQQAVSVLGVRSVRSTCLATCLVGGFNRKSRYLPDRQLWFDCLVSALSARRLSDNLRGVSSDDAFMTGLLKNVGIFVLQEALGEIYADWVRAADRSGGGDRAARERQELGYCYADVSAALIDRWALPASWSEAVRQHETTEVPGAAADDACLGTILHVAEAYRRVFHVPDQVRVAELKRRNLKCLGRAEELVVEDLGFVETHVADMARNLDLRCITTDRIQEIRARATEQLVHELLGRQAVPTERRLQRLGLTVFRVGVDRLPLLVERLGRRCVSEILREVGDRLRRRLRSTDSVMTWQGQGFLVLAPHCAGDDSLRLGQSLTEAIRRLPVETVDGLQSVTVSIGVGWTARDEVTDFARLVAVASDCLAVVTEHGGDDVFGRPLVADILTAKVSSDLAD